MNSKVKELWLEALKSGEYEQGYCNLNNEGKFCCLGVLCDLAYKAGITDMMYRHGQDEGIVAYGTSRQDSSVMLLPQSVRDWAELRDFSPRVKNPGNLPSVEDEITLTLVNDSRLYTFAQIADLIDESL